MSVYYTAHVDCPSCGTNNPADIFNSVNADRRPDLRQQILDGSFQVVTCSSCGTAFRFDPEFNYLDQARGQWIAVHPLGRLGRWQEVLADDRAAFDKSYGPTASAGAREIGATLTARVTFGWPAFREKLVAAASGVDDRELELLKIALLRTQDHSPLSQTVELRLVNVADGNLVLQWVDAPTDRIVETLLVPMPAYETIAADGDGWAPLRVEIAANPFVDMQRLML